MKNKIYELIEILIFVLFGILIGLNLYNPNDVNRDRKVSASDYVQIRNYIMKGCDK